MDKLKICIEQGYVPPECKVDGTLVWLLINEGKNPCVGCNIDCIHKIRSECVKENYISREDLERQERIRIRKELGTNSETIIYVDIELNDITILAINPDLEKGYIVRCKNRTEDMYYYISAMCDKYNAKQVIIPLNGCGLSIYNWLKTRYLKDIDIVPIKYVKANL